nr:hypothetical protein [uncultured Methanospirillum sp.]
MQIKTTAPIGAAFLQSLQITAFTIHVVVPALILLAGAVSYHVGWIV